MFSGSNFYHTLREECCDMLPAACYVYTCILLHRLLLYLDESERRHPQGTASRALAHAITSSSGGSALTELP